MTDSDPMCAPSTEGRGWPSWWGYGWVTLLGVTAGFVRDFSGDFHWHVVLGNWMLLHRARMRVDVLSHTFAGHPMFNDSWIGDVLLALGHQAAGYPGCYLLRGLALGALLVLLTREGRRQGLSMWTATLLPTLLLSEFLLRFYLRPETFTFPLLAGLLLLLGEHERNGKLGRLLWVLPIVILWANLHGSVSIGLLVVDTYCLEKIVRIWFSTERDRRTLAQYFVMPAAAFLAATLNPEGLREPLMFLRISANDPTFQAGVEWLPLSLSTLSEAFPLIMGAIVVSCVLAGRSVSVWRLLTVVVLVGVATQHGRFIKAAFICAVPLVFGNFALFCQRALRPLAPGRWRMLRAGLLGVCSLGTGLLLFQENGFAKELGLGLAPNVYPEKACQFARRSQLPHEMLNSFDIGSYLMYCLPEHRVYFDQRAASLYTPEFSREYAAQASDGDLLESRVKTYKVSFAFVTYDPLARQLNSQASRWKLIYFDDQALLYLRADILADSARPTMQWLSPLDLPSLSTLNGDALRQCGQELALQQSRCAECRRTQLAAAALAVARRDWPEFTRLLGHITTQQDPDTEFLLGVYAFHQGNHAAARAIFWNHVEHGHDPAGAAVWLDRTLASLNDQQSRIALRQLAQQAVVGPTLQQYARELLLATQAAP